MKLPRRPSLIALAIIAFCVWQASGILGAWRADPQNYLGWAALLIWLSPAIYLCIRPSSVSDSAILLWTGLGLSLFGALGSVNALHYLGFTCAVAGAVGWSWKLLPWFVCSIGWMPVFGYFASKAMPQKLIMPARLSIALLAAGWTLFAILRPKSGK